MLIDASRSWSAVAERSGDNRFSWESVVTETGVALRGNKKRCRNTGTDEEDNWTGLKPGPDGSTRLICPALD
jgi:hypothetical protein